MSEALREQLSALMDGELPRDQMRFLLRGIDADAQLAQSWTRYQLAGAVIRRQIAFVPVDADFSGRVMQALAQQPAHGGYGLRVLRWAGGGAIAAAVAVIALVANRPAADMRAAPAALVASATPAASAPRQSGTLMPIAPSFDYAQPASFDTGVVNLPRYDQRAYATVPYVLLIQPAQQKPVPAPTPQQR